QPMAEPAGARARRPVSGGPWLLHRMEIGLWLWPLVTRFTHRSTAGQVGHPTGTLSPGDRWRLQPMAESSWLQLTRTSSTLRSMAAQTGRQGIALATGLGLPPQRTATSSSRWTMVTVLVWVARFTLLRTAE